MKIVELPDPACSFCGGTHYVKDDRGKPLCCPRCHFQDLTPPNNPHMFVQGECRLTVQPRPSAWPISDAPCHYVPYFKEEK